MNSKPKTKYRRMKELKEDLHWYQHLVRMDIMSLKSSIEAVKRKASELRKVQGEKKCDLPVRRIENYKKIV